MSADDFGVGLERRRALQDAGFSEDELATWETDKRAELSGAGFEPGEVDAYFGVRPPVDLGPLQERFDDAFSPLDPMSHAKLVANPGEAIAAGLQLSGIGVGATRADPSLVLGENAGLFYQILAGGGQMVGDLPLAIAGFALGAPAGTAAGGAAGGAVAGPPGAAVGGTVGFFAGGGFGSAALPAAMRETLTAIYTADPNITWKDAYGKAVGIIWNTLREGTAGAAGGVVGGPIGAKVAGKFGAVAGATAETIANAATGTAVFGAFEGRVPDASDFAAATALALGTTAGHMVVTGGYKHWKMNGEGRKFEQNLQRIYENTGIPPWKILAEAQSNPIIMHEVLAPMRGDGTIDTPTVNAMREPEPKDPYPIKPTLDATTVEAAEAKIREKLQPPEPKADGTPGDDTREPLRLDEATPEQLNGYLGIFRHLENTAGYSQRTGVPVNEAVSPAGAVGEFQIMPGTAEQYGYDPRLLTDPGYNATVARTILADLHKRYDGDIEAMAVAYNAGPKRADRWRKNGRHWESLPKETQRYLQRLEATGAIDNQGYNSIQFDKVLQKFGDDGSWMPDTSHGLLTSTNKWASFVERSGEYAFDTSTEAIKANGGRPLPNSRLIATYLQDIGREIGVTFQVGDVTPDILSRGGPHYQSFGYNKYNKQAGDGPHSRVVFMPRAAEGAFERWVGLRPEQILWHEVAHALHHTVIPDGFGDTLRGGDASVSQVGEMGGIAPDVFAEAKEASQAWSPKLWSMPNQRAYKSQPIEIMADAIAVWLSDPTARARMPSFTAMYGKYLQKYADIAGRALPKRMGSNDKWEMPGDGGSAGGSDYDEDPETQSGPGGGGGDVPPTLPPDWLEEPPKKPKKVKTTRLQKDVAMEREILADMLVPEQNRRAMNNVRELAASFQAGLKPAVRLDRKLNIPWTDIGIEDLARQIYGAASQASHFLRYGTLDPVTLAKKSDDSYLGGFKLAKENGGDAEGLTLYRLAKHAIEKHNQGIDILPPDALKVAQSYAARSSEINKFEAAARMISRVKDASVDWVMDSGRFTPELAAALKALNRYHIVTRRLMDPTYNPPRFEGTGTIRKKKGSELQIVDPITADIDNLHTLIAMGNRNRMMGGIIALVEKHNPKAQTDNLLPFYRDENMSAQLQIEYEKGLTGDLLGPDGKPLLDENGAPMSTEARKAANAVKEAFLAEKRLFEKMGPDHFLYFRNGKPEVWVAKDPDLAELLHIPWNPKPDFLPKVLTSFANLQRLGISATPDFALRSITYGQLYAGVVSPGGSMMPFRDIMTGLFNAFSKDASGARRMSDLWQEWVASGGANATLAGLYRDHVQMDVESIFRETGTTWAVSNAVKHPIQALQALTHAADNMARFGFYARNVKRFGQLKAGMMSRTAYIDHAEPLGRAGTQSYTIVDTFARTVPFFSTSVKDAHGVLRSFHERPWPTAFKAALVLSMPTFVNYFANILADEFLDEEDRYHNVPQWERDLYHVLPPIMGYRMKIKKLPSSLTMAFSIMPERFMDFALSRDPRSFDGMFDAIRSIVLPPFLPTFVVPWIEDKFNTDTMTMRPLRSAGSEKATGYLDYKPDTTEAAKNLTRLLGPPMLNIVDWNPIVLENYIKEWSGTLPMAILKTAERTFGIKDVQKPWQPADMLFLGSFFVRNRPGGEMINRYYEAFDAFTGAKQGLKLAMERGDMREIKEASTIPALVKASTIHKALAGQRAAIEVIERNPNMTMDEKRQQIDSIGAGMFQIAKAGLFMLDELQKAETARLANQPVE